MLSAAQVEGKTVQTRHYMEENHRRPRVAMVRYMLITSLFSLWVFLHREPPIDDITRADREVIKKGHDSIRHLTLSILDNGHSCAFHLRREHLTLKCLYVLNA